MTFYHSKRSVSRFLRIVRGAAIISFALAVFLSSSCFGATLLRKAFPSVEDAHVKSGSSAKKNFGQESTLELQNNRGGASEAYLKFNVAGIDPSMREAKLRIYAGAEKPDLTAIFVRSTATTDWQEGAISWKDKPDHLSSLGKILAVGTVATWYEVDITQFLKSEMMARNQTISIALVIEEGSNNKISIHSREAGANVPEIVAGRTLFTAKIVFQPKEKEVPFGYLVDSGAVFGPRLNTGLTFGWSSDIAPFVKDRAVPAKDDPLPAKGPDARYMGVAFMDHPDMKQPAFWEIAVPNGKYKVHLVAGDASYYDSIYAINVEGNLLIDGIPDGPKRWAEGAQVVTVQDGRLTVNGHTKGINNKLCFLEISEVAGP